MKENQEKEKICYICGKEFEIPYLSMEFNPPWYKFWEKPEVRNYHARCAWEGGVGFKGVVL